MINTVRKLEKHPFNVFPAMNAEERKQVRLDIEMYTYDNSFPITLYQGKVLDGWNRQQICEELGVAPLYKEFSGNDLEALDFVWRSNRRRNLTSSQWSTIATEAQPIIDAIHEAVKKEKAEKLEGNQNASSEKPLVESILPIEKPKRDDSKRAAVKLAKQFNTNAKYIAKAKELKTSNPEVFEQVKNGELSINDLMHAEKMEDLKSHKARTKTMKVSADVSNPSAETAIMVGESAPVELTKSTTELTVGISEDLLIKLKAYAKAQNVVMKHLDWNMDYKQAAVDLLEKGIVHPPFEYDTDAMKVFNEEIRKLGEK